MEEICTRRVIVQQIHCNAVFSGSKISLMWGIGVLSNLYMPSGTCFSTFSFSTLENQCEIEDKAQIYRSNLLLYFWRIKAHHIRKLTSPPMPASSEILFPNQNGVKIFLKFSIYKLKVQKSNHFNLIIRNARIKKLCRPSFLKYVSTNFLFNAAGEWEIV